MDKSKEERKAVFKPCRTFRYLPNSVPRQFNMGDLNWYNSHREKIFYMKPKVDDKPCKLNPYLWLNPTKLRNDAAKTIKIDKENKQLLERINLINRTRGDIDSYNPIAYRRNDNWKRTVLSEKRRVKENKEIYFLIKNAKAHYNKRSFDEFWKNSLKSMKHIARYPLVILEESNLSRPISISQGLNIKNPGNRPFCFFEFQVLGGEYIGKVIAELYHDIVPITVQNFLSICRGDRGLTYQRCPVHRIIKNKFLETGDITHGNGRGGRSIYGGDFPEESHLLRHTKTGVLSMKRLTPALNNSQFLITFASLVEFDKKNVVFGHIVIGLKHLTKIEGYARKIGKPYADVVISNCGVVPREEVNIPIDKNVKKRRGSGVNKNMGNVKVKGCKCKGPCGGI